ncbi:MAG TPA: zinc ribbon domain-containing protein [Chthoniobacteraceae bacterium]|nr:zinc ribbon domain-containing protein [Chthoniobacteraceae bacterium]
MPPETPGEISDPGEKQLCAKCLEPNDPNANFCVKCGVPLSSYAATGPLEQVFAQGDLYRSAANRPVKFIVFLGVWLLFMPAGMAGAWVVIQGFAGGTGGGFINTLLYMLLGLASVVLSTVMIWKTGCNYFAGKKEEPSSDPADS